MNQYYSTKESRARRPYHFVFKAASGRTFELDHYMIEDCKGQAAVSCKALGDTATVTDNRTGQKVAEYTRDESGKLVTLYDESRKFYYVSVHNGKEYRLLAGPFGSHREALERVREVEREAKQLDPRAPFYAYGTCGSDEYQGEGELNNELRN